MSFTPGTLGRGHPDPGQVPYSAPGSPRAHPLVVGFIGLGNMGAAIARNFIIHTAKHKTGSEVLLWNRTTAKATALHEEIEQHLSTAGAIVPCKVSESIDELVGEADVIITSTPTDATMLDLATKIGKAINLSTSKNRIVVDMSTVYPTTAGKVDATLTAHAHTHFVQSPVFGAPQIAKDAKLLIALAGDYVSKKRIAYLLVPAVGRKVIDLGGNVEKAAAFKLLGNSYIVGNLELLGETHAFAQKLGIGSATLHEWLQDMYPAPSIVNYSKRILEDNFDGSTGFNIDGGLKDVHHMQRLASEHNVPVPIVDIAQQHIVSARAINATLPAYQRSSNLDWSAVAAASRAAAGLDPFDSAKHKIGPVPESESDDQ